MTDLLPLARCDIETPGRSDLGLTRLDTYWRAASYLAVWQIYLLDNALVREPLRPEHTKPRLIGHWGTSPGLNFADLMRLESDSEHPHGLSEVDFDTIFTTDRPVIFAFHGYPALVHRLTYRRTNHENFHVHDYREDGMTTSPFDMVMLNDLDRFRLVIDVLDRLPELAEHSASLRQEMIDARLEARLYTREHGEDPPEISGWTWTPTHADGQQFSSGGARDGL